MKDRTPFMHALTEDDRNIWDWVWCRDCTDNAMVLRLLSASVDQVDAQLMLEATNIARFGDSAIELYGISCRGWSTPELAKVAR